MLPPLCAWILPNGHACAQFARRSRRFCRAHEKHARIEQGNVELRRMLQNVLTCDLYSLIVLLQDTLDQIVEHRISPDRAQLILQAARQRFEEPASLVPEEAVPDFDPAPQPPARAQRTGSPNPFARSLTMEDVFGPRAAGMPTPPDLDLNLFVRTMNDLNTFYPNGCSPKPPKSPVTSAPSVTSTLNLVP
jgi:hypothetical protein